ncbi:MAG: divalent-cation tolerance protein CutA [Planctomycetota bacterium]|nr:MAG: divalent-cation tolerance protein CutA [Planctomycetota bacterium]
MSDDVVSPQPTPALADDERLCLLWATAPSLIAAESLATQLLEARVAACVNIFPSMRSCYEWQGSICRNEEVGMLIKVPRCRAEACAEALRQHHPYDVPCILRLAVDGAHPPFATWLHEQTVDSQG